MNKNLQCLISIFFLAFLPIGFCNAQTYCIPTDLCSFDDYIQSFSTTGGTTNITNNNTGCGGTGYTFYSTMIHSGVPGGTVNYSFTNTPDWPEYYKIWVDWNADGDFTDLGEEMYASSTNITSGAITTGSFVIPPGTASGNKRFRIRCGYAEAALTPCDPSFIDDGETEDYLLFVGSSACSGTPTGGTTNAAATSITCNTTTTLSLTGNTIGTGLTYQWQYNTSGSWVNFGTNATTQTTPNVTQNTQFRCMLTCTNSGGGSSASSPVMVSVINPVLNLGNDTSICPGVSYTFNAGSSGTYLWSTGATTQSITINAANVYFVKVTFANGCKTSDTIVVTPGIVPINNLVATTNLCNGDTAILNAGNAGSTYLWSPGGAVTQMLHTTSNGNYTVIVKSIDGCKITSNSTIISRPLPVPNLGNDTSICDGATIVLDAGNPGYSYLWNTGATIQSVNASDSGTYSVTTTTPYGCHIAEAEHVAYLPSPRVEGFNFIPQFYAALGQVVFTPLDPTNVMTYEWDFGDSSMVSTEQNPIHTYAIGGSYNVKLRVFNGCGNFQQAQTINVDLTTGTVTIKDQEANVAIFPNPANNNLTIKNFSTDIQMLEVSVFNTLGALVYRSAATSQKQHTLSVSNFASGIYSLRILTNKGYIIRKVEVLK